MNKKVMELFDNYKIVVYIPKGYEKTIISQLQEHIVNTIGEYLNCMSWGDVHSTWTATNSAKPFIGKAGEQSVEPEVRLEFLCNKKNLCEIVNCINDIHPYEKAEIDIIPFFSPDELFEKQK